MEFPQLKLQEQIDREQRIEWWAELGKSALGALALAATFIAGMWIGYGAGAW